MTYFESNRSMDLMTKSPEVDGPGEGDEVADGDGECGEARGERESERE
jgi:hypothetical protein